MRRISYLIAITLITASILASCNDTTYAQELKAEQLLIKNYIKRDSINVLKQEPDSNYVWGKKDYWLTSTGLYFHLESKGSGAKLKTSDIVVPRYIQYTLDEVPVTVSHWSTSDDEYPTTFVYGSGSYTSVCTAFNEAASYMKRNDSEAKIIVHSKIGFTINQSPATPMGYTLKIKIQK